MANLIRLRKGHLWLKLCRFWRPYPKVSSPGMNFAQGLWDSAKPTLREQGDEL
ncbi:MAG: hypothetical protein F6K56_10960 [Moorea sp. SIO3G5]|nr:hypothetical protein [Moorena sp. SIO3G5]